MTDEDKGDPETTVPAPARILLVKDEEGEYKVTLPTNARVTFGPNVPFARKGEYSNPHGYSLRVYADATNNSLMAVFSNVVRFRDLTIPVAHLVVRESGKALWKSDEDGYEVTQEVKRAKSFEDEVKLLDSAE